MLPGALLPISDGALIEAKGDHNGLERAAVRQQGQHQRDGLLGGAQAFKHGAFAGDEGCATGGALIAWWLAAKDTAVDGLVGKRYQSMVCCIVSQWTKTGGRHRRWARLPLPRARWRATLAASSPSAKSLFSAFFAWTVSGICRRGCNRENLARERRHVHGRVGKPAQTGDEGCRKP